MNAIVWMLSGLGLGWGLSRLFDPAVGSRQRALLRDKVVSAAHAVGDAVDTTSRDITNRTEGVIADVRSQLSRQAISDPVLQERVRARLGGLVRHPRSIEVNVRDGRVTLRGPVLADEVERLLHRVESVRGVRGVESQLEVHTTPGDVPGLQGEGTPAPGGERFELLQRQWSPTARMLVGLAGGVLTLTGIRRRGITGTVLGAGGLAALARALTNVELKRLLGVGAGRGAVMVQKTITVAAPIEDVFDFWRHYENFPQFMAHVHEVRRTGPGRARWTVAGPAGVPIEWETEETRVEPPHLLAWKTVDGASVAHAGVVRFDEDAQGTRIHIQMRYTPAAGALGHALATLLGADPKQALDEDLARFKSLFEDGKTSIEGRTVHREAPGLSAGGER